MRRNESVFPCARRKRASPGLGLGFQSGIRVWFEMFPAKGTFESKPPVALAALLRGNGRVGSCEILSSPAARPESGWGYWMICPVGHVDVACAPVESPACFFEPGGCGPQ
jgi:hypothetical protein